MDLDLALIRISMILTLIGSRAEYLEYLEYFGVFGVLFCQRSQVHSNALLQICVAKCLNVGVTSLVRRN